MVLKNNLKISNLLIRIIAAVYSIVGLIHTILITILNLSKQVSVSTTKANIVKLFNPVKIKGSKNLTSSEITSLVVKFNAIRLMVFYWNSLIVSTKDFHLRRLANK